MYFVDVLKIKINCINKFDLFILFTMKSIYCSQTKVFIVFLDETLKYYSISIIISNNLIRFIYLKIKYKST